jgi:small GTP-binding protein
MGSLLSSLYGLWSGTRNYKLLIVGLNNAGKTSILYSLQLNKFISTQPTIGGNAEEIKFRNLTFVAWDLGGQEQLREVWHMYYHATDAVIFVVDSAEPARFSVAHKELQQLLQHDELKDACVLVFANKQDLQGAMPPEKIIEALGLANFSDRKWTVQGCSAVTQQGLHDGMSWISAQLGDEPS